MTEVELTPGFKTAGLIWNRELPFDKKVSYLKTLFGCPLNEVNFWDLYKAVKKLNL